jgi:nucleotide-binding universal stress UspA family protein
MIEVRHILCPTDFSDFSRRALEQAAALARWYVAEITVIHVHAYAPAPPPEMPWLPAAVVLSPELRQRMLADLRDFVEPIRRTGVRVQVVLAEGPPPAEIVAFAHGASCDLVVMGTHGRSGFERLVLGSVTERVQRAAPCPVLTVSRPGAFARAAGPFRRIVCAVDFASTSESTVRYAFSLAEEAGAEVVLLHVLHGSTYRPSRTPFRLDMTEQRREVEGFVREDLRRLVPDGAPKWCRPEEMVRWGSASREILAVAESRQADVIVMGAHGTPLAKTLFGSTAAEVVRGAPCPVLTVRPRAHPTAADDRELVGAAHSSRDEQER